MEVSATLVASADPGATTGTAEPVVPSLAAGTLLADRYRIDSLLGRGGMGEVYLGEHVTLGLRVAIKVAGPWLFNEATIRRRFLHEARAASRIRHEHVIEISDFGYTSEGLPFFVMEHLEGEELARTIEREGRLAPARACAVVVQILSALSAAHALGIVHRDIKPQNCFRVTRRGDPDHIKVLDFGLAKVLSDHLDEQDMTRSGTVMGTAKYMPPEQAKGEKVDARADIYAVGVLLCQLLTGKLPFESASFMGLLHRHIHERPPSLRKLAPDAGISPKLDAAVLRALAKSPDDRYQSADEFAAALQALGPPTAGRRSIWPWTIGGVAAALALVVATRPDLGSTPEAVVPETPTAAAPDPAPTTQTTPVVVPEAAAAPLPTPTTQTTPLQPVAKPTSESPATSTPPSSIAEAPTAVPDDPPSERGKPRVQRIKPPVEPATPAASTLPERIGDAQLRLALAGVNEVVRQCGRRYGALPGERVEVTLDVAADGAQQGREVRLTSPNEPMRRCITQALEQVTLPPARAGGRYHHSFSL